MIKLKIKTFLISIVFIYFSFGNNPVFTISDSVFYESDMYDFYGMAAWNRATVEQKKQMIDDFLVREGAFLSAKNEGLNFSSSFKEKVYNKKRQLLVNYVYQIDVSQMGLDSARYKKGETFLKKDVLVHHILFGFEGSALRVPVERTKEDAYFLCSSILDTLTLSSFSAVAAAFSDDGSANRNLGKLGWVSWGSTVPEFEKNVFGQPVKEILGPIETEFGYHIAYIEKERPSSFSFLSNDEFLDAVLLRSSSKNVSKLKSFSSSYDSTVLSNGNIVFNDSLVVSVFSSINNSLLNNSLNKNDIIAVLEKNKTPGVICVFNEKAYGIEWFINRLSFYSPSNRPNIQNLDSFYSILKTVLLQEQAYVSGVSRAFDSREGFKKQLLSFEKDLLYTLYFKNLVNNVKKPDSTSVQNHYFNNRDEKYLTPLSLKLEEITVNDFGLADSLLGLYIEGESFTSLSKSYSSKSSLESGSLVGPVEKGYKKGALKDYFNKDVFEGFVGDIINNKDGSYSIYRINKVYPESYIPLKKVYSRISSFLHRENQEKAKLKAIENFYKEHNIVKKDTLF